MSEGQSEEKLVLVQDGKARSTIVVPDDADWWQRMAAGWLQEYIEKATGAKLPIVPESKVPQGPLIAVGPTDLARRAGLETDDLKWDGCRLVVQGEVLYLLGRDGVGVGRDDPTPEQMKDYLEGDPWRPDRIWGSHQADLAGPNGTCKAVVTFLEDFCGVRWFMPFEQGIQIPQTRDLAVSRDLNRTVTPVFAYAIGSFLYGSPRLYPSAYANNFRFGIRLRTFGGHSWYHWVPAALFEEHPEYFALRNGQRTAEGNHLCTTNPEVRELLLQGIRAEFDRGYEWVQLGQTDGWHRCECEECEAQDNFRPWDPQTDGPDWDKWLHTTHRENPVERLHLLHHWIAQQCARSHPGRKVHLLAYVPTRWPSRKIPRYSPNVVAELCHDIPEMIDAWSEKVSAMTAYKIWWDMSWIYGYGPDVTPKEVADEIRYLRDRGVIGLFNGGDGHNWGLNGPVFYTLGKLLGNPDRDEYALVREYCHGVYGDAGEKMYEFFLRLYKRPMRRNKLPPDAPYAENIRTRFPPSLIRELDQLLAQAEAVGVTGPAADNLRMTRIQLDYLRRVTYLWVAYQAHLIAQSPASLAELKRHVNAFEDFRQEILNWDPDEAEKRFPDWGHLCKWLTGSSYWESWPQIRNRMDRESVRGQPVGYYAQIREPLTLHFEE